MSLTSTIEHAVRELENNKAEERARRKAARIQAKVAKKAAKQAAKDEERAAREAINAPIALTKLPTAVSHQLTSVFGAEAAELEVRYDTFGMSDRGADVSVYSVKGLPLRRGYTAWVTLTETTFAPTPSFPGIGTFVVLPSWWRRALKGRFGRHSFFGIDRNRALWVATLGDIAEYC